MTRFRRLIDESRSAATIARFRKEADGIALAFFLVAMPVFIGLCLLAIDIGRGNNLHYDVQKAVDALSVAAAAELDGGPDSITRANAALEGMLQNGARFNDGPDVGRFGLTPDNVRVDYLCNLPISDDTPIDTRACVPGGPGNVTTQASIARFAWVRARNVPGGGDFRQRMTTLFPIHLLAGEGRDTVAFGAEAVAGGTQGASGSKCGVAPVYICNPFEGGANAINDANLTSLHDLVGPTLEDKTTRNPHYGRMIEFKQRGNIGSTGPGNWGYLNSGGASDLWEEIATGGSEDICIENGVATTKPGFNASVRTGFDVRFGMYTQSHSQTSWRQNPDYVPATNVRTGYTGRPSSPWSGSGNKPCPEGTKGASDGSDDVMGMNPDQTWTNINMNGGRIGNGDWNFQTYWEVNFGHPGAGGPNSDGSYPIPDGWSNENPPSRYEMYQYEINNGLVNVPSIGGETGFPGCWAGEEALVDPANYDPDNDRRLITVAVVNCEQEAVHGRDDVAISFYAEMFLTEPVDVGDDDAEAIQGEIIEVSGVDGSGRFGVSNLNPEVVLYR